MSELVEVERIAEIIPYKPRQIIAMAKSGVIPGVLQLVPGGKWLFDEGRVRQWLKQLEADKCQGTNQTCVSAVKSGTSKSKETAKQSVNQLANRLWPKRENTATAH